MAKKRPRPKETRIPARAEASVDRPSQRAMRFIGPDGCGRAAPGGESTDAILESLFPGKRLLGMFDHVLDPVAEVGPQGQADQALADVVGIRHVAVDAAITLAGRR